MSWLAEKAKKISYNEIDDLANLVDLDCKGSKTLTESKNKKFNQQNLYNGKKKYGSNEHADNQQTDKFTSKIPDFKGKKKGGSAKEQNGHSTNANRLTKEFEVTSKKDKGL